MKPITEARNTRLRPMRTASHPDERRHDGRGDDVGREHPHHLVLRAGKAALHVRQGDGRDGGVDRLHDRGRHHAGGDQRAVERREPAPGRQRSALQLRPLVRRADSATRSTSVDGRGRFIIRERRALLIVRVDFHGGAQAREQRMLAIRVVDLDAHGRRCTTFTQLPVAFCAGSTRELRAGAGAQARDVRLEGAGRRTCRSRPWRAGRPASSRAALP